MNAANAEDDPACLSLAVLLRRSPRVLCLTGAGLSAPSGIPTWRGTNGLWNERTPQSLASPVTFMEDPVTVWTFYGTRLLESMAAEPNAAHHAIASLASWHDGWLTVNQNVDGLLERTSHPVSRLLNIHGDLRLIRCEACDYKIRIQQAEDLPFLMTLSTGIDPQKIAHLHLPRCPECSMLLRPGVVWFGERLVAGAPDNIDEWLLEEGIELVIVVGTSLQVFPTAEWANVARSNGATLALIDLVKDHEVLGELQDGDLFFEKDVTIVLPEVLRLLNTRWNVPT